MIAAIFLGLVTAIGFKIYGKSRNVRWVITLLLGVTGAVFAQFLGAKAGLYVMYEPMAIVASIVGATLILGLYSFLLRKTQQLN